MRGADDICRPAAELGGDVAHGLELHKRRVVWNTSAALEREAVQHVRLLNAPHKSRATRLNGRSDGFEAQDVAEEEEIVEFHAIHGLTKVA